MSSQNEYIILPLDKYFGKKGTKHINYIVILKHVKGHLLFMYSLLNNYMIYIKIYLYPLQLQRYLSCIILYFWTLISVLFLIVCNFIHGFKFYL